MGAEGADCKLHRKSGTRSRNEAVKFRQPKFYKMKRSVAQLPGATSPFVLGVVLCCLIVVGPQCKTCFMSPL